MDTSILVNLKEMLVSYTIYNLDEKWNSELGDYL